MIAWHMTRMTKRTANGGFGRIRPGFFWRVSVVPN